MRIELPRGQHADICDPEEITGEQKRVYQAAADKMMYPGGADMVQVPDPENPAVMTLVTPPRARLTAENIQRLRDLVHGFCITAWSYDLPLPVAAGPDPDAIAKAYAEALKTMPALADDKIEAELASHYENVFNGFGPKESPETTTTSVSSSPGSAAAPPAVLASELSGGASG